MIKYLEKIVVLPTSIEKCWSFLQNPANLNAITPPDLQFRIISPIPEEMHEGLLIEYLIRIPMLGRQRWLTEIRHVREKCSFVDEQRYGPFRFWYHLHELRPGEGGVISRDLVTYVMPLGLLGECIHLLYVRRTLERIFSYRKQRLLDIFSAVP